jgi:phosphatidylinositol glycan class M
MGAVDKLSSLQWLTTRRALVLAALLRVGFFVWGVYQDANMEPRYTDIDYFVFTDAARFVYNGNSPYQRETYRYTPLLAWMLVPTVSWFFAFGKVLFSIGDMLAGYLLIKTLQLRNASNSDCKQ